MSLPSDLANLLAIAVRDVIWFKDNVYSFLVGCGVPRPVLVEVKRIKNDTPTIKLVHYVLNELSERGDEGDLVAKKLLTQMYYWNDLHSVAEDRRDKAMIDKVSATIILQTFMEMKKNGTMPVK